MRPRVPRVRIAVGLAITAVALTLLAVDHWRASDSGAVATGPLPGSTVATTVPSTPTTRVYVDPVAYVIQPGETLFDIAKRNGLTTDELARFNGITNPDSIQAGDRILIPPPSAVTTTVATRPPGPTTTTTLPVATTMPDDPPPTLAPPPTEPAPIFGVPVTSSAP